MSKNDVSRRGAIVGLGSVVGGVACEYGETGAVEEYGVVQSAVGTPISAQLLRGISLPGVHAYAQRSVTAGSTVEFRVSNASRYRLSIVRLGWYEDGHQRPDGTTSEWLIHRFAWREGVNLQLIRPGSYIHVPSALSTTSSFSRLSLELWIRPWCNQFAGLPTNSWRGLISQYTTPTNCGFGLFLDDQNRPVAYFGDGSTFANQWLVACPTALTWGEWSHVVAVFDAGTVSFYINGQFRGSLVTSRSTVVPAFAPLRIGAYGENALTDHVVDADIAMPCIYSRALSSSEISGRANSPNPPAVPGSAGLIGCWPLDEENGLTVRDASPEQRSGVIINRGTWMIGGPTYDAAGIDPYTAYNWRIDATRGHGLRLSADDLYDCAWLPTDSYTLSPDLPPGLYAGRIEYPDETPRYDVTFVVRRANSKPAAPILVLCSTNTWQAYSAPFPHTPDMREWGLGGPGVSVPRTPALNMYNDHAVTGVPSYQMGTKMPWSAFPYAMYGAPYSHLVRAERYLHNWLEQNGFDYDVASDFDLHQTPSLLSSHKVVVICGHSEYWSAPAYNGLKQFLEAGGRVFMASGNTLFWRVSYDAAGDVMECRKWPSSVGGRPAAKVGELYHSQDGARGGLMREAGYPAYKLLGLECVGYGAVPADFTVRASAHSFFTTPEPVGAANGDTLAIGAIHHEYDVRLATIPAGPGKPGLEAGTQPTLLADGPVHPETGSDDDVRFDYRGNFVDGSGVGGEMIDWSRPTGGRVFGAGGIAVASKLGSDAKLAALARNVLHQFGVPQRLEFAIVDSAKHVRVRSWDGAAWEPVPANWTDLGGSIEGPLHLLGWSPNTVSVMGRNSTGQLLYKYRIGANWAANWTHLGGQLVGRPTAVSYGRNRFSIFARNLTGDIVGKWWDGTSWGPSETGWLSIGALGLPMVSDPAAVVFEGVKVGVAAIASDFNLYYKYFDGVNWTAWSSMGGQYKSSPCFVKWGGNKINLFAVNRTTGALATRHFNGRSWDPTTYGLGGSLAGAPVAVGRRANEFSIFAVHTDGTIKVKWWDGSNWGPSQTGWQSLGGSFVGTPTAVSWRGNHVGVLGMGPEGPSGKLNYKWTDGLNWFPSQLGWTDIRGDVVGPLGNPSSAAWIGA